MITTWLQQSKEGKLCKSVENVHELGVLFNQKFARDKIFLDYDWGWTSYNSYYIKVNSDLNIQ